MLPFDDVLEICARPDYAPGLRRVLQMPATGRSLWREGPLSDQLMDDGPPLEVHSVADAMARTTRRI
jgi:hypothetical protein